MNRLKKRTKPSLLPNKEPVTMRDRYNSFIDQFYYDTDFDQVDEEQENKSKKTSVCVVWPRPRFMLQINTPSISNFQPYYQNKPNLMPTVQINQTTSQPTYTKRKYHSKKDDNLNKLNQKSEDSISYYSSSEQFYTIPQLQNIPQISRSSSDFVSQNDNNIKSTQNQIEEASQSQEIENDFALDQIQPLPSSMSQPQITYQNQQQIKAKKMKAKIIQHPLNVPGIQYALQQQEQLMKLTPYQKLQQIQQIQKLQFRNKSQKQVQKQNQNETEVTNETVKNEFNNNNNESKEENFETSQTDPNKEEKKRKYKTRQSFTPEQKMLLEKFIYDHIDHPYAEHEDLIMLERQTKLSRKQIRVFMTNTRMRKFANKIPVLKKSGSIVMRKGVPLHGQLARVDPKNQCLIQCYTKKGYPTKQAGKQVQPDQSDGTKGTQNNQ